MTQYRHFWNALSHRSRLEYRKTWIDFKIVLRGFCMLSNRNLPCYENVSLRLVVIVVVQHCPNWTDKVAQQWTYFNGSIWKWLKFSTELHMEVYNGCVLTRICICCTDKDVQDGVRQPFWIILPFIKCSFFMKQRWNLAKTSQFRSWID